VGDLTRRLVAAGRLVATLALLVAVVALVGGRAVGAKLLHLDVRFIVGFLLLSLPLYLLQAWRWRFTAGRLGAPIRFRRAYLDYYLSTLLNQVLPLGVAGDLVRAARHRGRLHQRSEGAVPSWGPAARAVVLERFSGLMGLSLFVVASALVWLLHRHNALVLGGAAVSLALVGAVLLFLGRASQWRWLFGLAVDGRKALLERGALGVQLAVSTAAVAILLTMFSCAARATGVALGPLTALQVVPLVLASTTLPWAFAGWGVREASTAALYSLVGLDASAGVAVSITFGVLSLLAALPGIVVLALPERVEP
jgi:uncharacterized membrane protein YbhN (UPF0104 family)